MSLITPNQIIHGDFYEELLKIRTKTVDMILTDLPYNMTQNKWESTLDLRGMWDLFHHVLKDNGIICLTSMQPFTSKLVMSNPKEFKYEIIWEKEKGTGHLNSKKQPLRYHENILFFYSKQPSYNPQFTQGKSYTHIGTASTTKNYGKQINYNTIINDGFRYPKSIIKYSKDNANHGDHPTQKPIKLFEYLIKTYSNEKDTILDCCAGSGTTAIACMNTNRNYICIEKEEKYYNIIQDRISSHLTKSKVSQSV